MPALLHDRDGTTWIGTSSGLIHYMDGAIKWYGENDGLKVPDVRAIAENSAGSIWFGTLGGGLGRLQNGKLRQFLKADGLSSDYIQCLHIDQDGTLWIGTYGNGLCRYRDQHFDKVSTENGLLNNFICDIEEDKYGNFWISSHNGIFRLTREELVACANGKISTVHCLSYGKGEGMPTLECSGGLQPASAKTADGRLWFPTSRGLVVVNPDESGNNRMQPPVVIEDIVANGRTLAQNPAPDQPLEFEPGLQRFEFHYTGLSFQAPEKILFEYQLQDWESDWMEAGTKRVAEYSYIPPGIMTASGAATAFPSNSASCRISGRPYGFAFSACWEGRCWSAAASCSSPASACGKNWSEFSANRPWSVNARASRRTSTTIWAPISRASRCSASPPTVNSIIRFTRASSSTAFLTPPAN
jgi:hypothetical protein